MYKLVAVLFLLFQVGTRTAFALEVDFDGNGAKNSEIVDVLHQKDNSLSSKTMPDRDAQKVSLKASMLTGDGELVEVHPVAVWQDKDGGSVQHYEFSPGTIVRWEITCGPYNLGKWFFKETYNQGQDEHTGHFYHPNPAPSLMMTGFSTSPSQPTGAIYSPVDSPFVTPTFSSPDPVYFWIKLPMYATRITEWDEAFGACSNSLESLIDVKVPNLVKMATGTSYILYNSVLAAQYHPESHWGQKSFIDELTTIANDYHAAFPKAKPIRINDISLPWGGRFDLKLGWGVDSHGQQSQESHTGHRLGVEGDISKISVPKANREKLLEIICKTTNFVYSEGDAPGESECYHVRSKFAELEFPFVNFDEAWDGRRKQCCKNNTVDVDPEVLKVCVSDPKPSTQP
ncbi:MAG: hypothetical protein M0025_02465 [Elusimicrobia bacterium]|nr:hypothetical protein [Elusimicrobiota bacterium]